MHQLNNPNTAQRPLLASILKFCLLGHMKIRGLLNQAHQNPYRPTLLPVHSMPAPPHMMQMPMIPNHYVGPAYSRIGPLPLRTFTYNIVIQNHNI